MKKSVKKYQRGGSMSPKANTSPSSRPKGYIKMSPSAISTMPKFKPGMKKGGSVSKKK